MGSSPPDPRSRRWAPARAAALCGLLAASSAGCQGKYLAGEAASALHVACARVPIDASLRERLAPPEREKLVWVARVLEFSSGELGLDTGDAYTTYYDTGGKPISTVVVASDPLALIPYRWHFPIAGTVPYKGFFDRARAEEERDRLSGKGLDTLIQPVPAFSTLGWFSDPLLSTMLRFPAGVLAETLIHELVHRTVYFPGSSEVNESLATAVSREATLRLLSKDFGDRSPQMEEYREDIARFDLREEVLDRLRSDLDALYRSPLSREAKLSRKAELFETASRALREAGLDGRLKPSNALLVLERQYKGLVPFFQAAMSALGDGPRGLIAYLKKFRGSPEAMERLAEETAAARSRRGA